MNHSCVVMKLHLLIRGPLFPLSPRSTGSQRRCSSLVQAWLRFPRIVQFVSAYGRILTWDS